MPASAEHSRVAFSARDWSTGVRSNVERLMTLRISLVAACCANAPARLFSRWRTLALSFFGDAIAWLPPSPSEALHGDPLTLRIQLERGGQELLQVLDRRSVGRRVVRDGGTSLHAGIVQREQLARLAIHDLSPGPFVQLTPSSRLPLRIADGRCDEMDVERVVGIRVLEELHVLPGPPKPLDVLAARCDRDPVVGGTMEQSNGSVADLLIVDILGVAWRVHGDVRGELDARRTMHALKPFEAGVERGHAALRKPHDTDASRVDARVSAEECEGTERIDHHAQRGELRLIGSGIYDATTGEAVDDEGGNADPVQLLSPPVNVRSDSPGAMNEDDRGKA